MSWKKLTALLLSAVMLLSLTGCSALDYKKALSLTETGDWAAAKEILVSLGDYKDAADRISNCDYHIALDAMAAGEVDRAIALFESLGDYEDAGAQLTECRYQKAAELLEKGRLDDAAEIFKTLGSYRDASEQYRECRYQKAVGFYEDGQFKDAAAIFLEVMNYKDADHYMVLTVLQDDQVLFVDSFVEGMNRYFSDEGLPYALTENVPSYERDRREFIMDELGDLWWVEVGFNPDDEKGASTSNGQINSIHVLGDARRLSDLDATLAKTLTGALVVMKTLDDNLSLEEMSAALLEAFNGLYAGVDVNHLTEEGYSARVEIPHDYYKCVAAVLLYPNYYRSLFTVTIPELVG